jgi:MoaA/NifB/PqqE/SkfB family radical SAM enzyme
MLTSLLVRVGEATNQTLVLPLVVFFPTSRCNSRCVSCDWWRSSGAGDLTLEEIDQVADALPGLGTRLVVFSGGEPLLRPEVFEAADLFRARGVSLHLLTSGILLERSAAEVARRFSRVVVSLDGATEALYRAVRGVAALTVVERGVAELRRRAPDLPVTARATLHRLNYPAMPELIEHARAMGLDGISFLPADLSSFAFGRDAVSDLGSLGLDAGQVAEFETVVEHTIRTHADDLASGFVAESAEKLRRLPQYYSALLGGARFPAVQCNAPWTSVVVEADGSVRPCFFHQRIGNVRATPLPLIVRDALSSFRGTLDVATNPVCTRCVCALKTGWRGAPWH